MTVKKGKPVSKQKIMKKKIALEELVCKICMVHTPFSLPQANSTLAFSVNQVIISTTYTNTMELTLWCKLLSDMMLLSEEVNIFIQRSPAFLVSCQSALID